MTITVKEARKILGKDADSMTDAEIEEVVNTLTLMPSDTIETIKHKILRKRDAKRLAELVYDMYQEEKANGEQNKKKHS